MISSVSSSYPVERCSMQLPMAIGGPPCFAASAAGDPHQASAQFHKLPACGDGEVAVFASSPMKDLQENGRKGGFLVGINRRRGGKGGKEVLRFRVSAQD